MNDSSMTASAGRHARTLFRSAALDAADDTAQPVPLQARLPSWRLIAVVYLVCAAAALGCAVAYAVACALAHAPAAP